jgi:hypothetical protein
MEYLYINALKRLLIDYFELEAALLPAKHEAFLCISSIP